MKDAYFRLFRRFHPDLRLDPKLADLAREIEAVSARVDEAYQVLIDPESRSRYESVLGPSRRTPPSVQRAPTPSSCLRAGDGRARPPRPGDRRGCRGPSPDSMPVASVDANVDTPTRLAEQVLQDARKLLAKEKYWDAIQKLERAVDLAKGTKVNQAIRILLAQTQGAEPEVAEGSGGVPPRHRARGPAVRRRIRGPGRDVQGGGTQEPGRAQLRKALELDPGHARARAELDELCPVRRADRPPPDDEGLTPPPTSFRPRGWSRAMARPDGGPGSTLSSLQRR